MPPAEVPAASSLISTAQFPRLIAQDPVALGGALKLQARHVLNGDFHNDL
jgi:hypothetical protein